MGRGNESETNHMVRCDANACYVFPRIMMSYCYANSATLPRVGESDWTTGPPDPPINMICIVEHTIDIIIIITITVIIIIVDCIVSCIDY